MSDKTHAWGKTRWNLRARCSEWNRNARRNGEFPNKRRETMAALRKEINKPNTTFTTTFRKTTLSKIRIISQSSRRRSWFGSACVATQRCFGRGGGRGGIRIAKRTELRNRHCGAEAWPDTPGVLLLREADGRVAGSGSLAGWIGEPIGDRRLLTMLIVGILARAPRERRSRGGASAHRSLEMHERCILTVSRIALRLRCT